MEAVRSYAVLYDPHRASTAPVTLDILIRLISILIPYDRFDTFR